MSSFDRIPGGEAEKSLKRALTAEPTPESAKGTVAQGVARLLASGGVVLALRDRCGYRSDSHALPLAKICGNATYRSFARASIES